MKKFVTASVLSLALVAFTASIALANYGDDNSLSGKVRVKGTLVPIAKAKVSLYKTNGSKVDSDKTNDNGKYSFKDLQERKYVIKVRANGYRSPKNALKDSVSYTVKVDGSTKKNVYLVKE